MLLNPQAPVVVQELTHRGAALGDLAQVVAHIVDKRGGNARLGLAGLVAVGIEVVRDALAGVEVVPHLGQLVAVVVLVAEVLDRGAAGGHVGVIDLG